MNKTPEEIKKGLECRIRLHEELCDCLCSKCQFLVRDYTRAKLNKDALVYIQQLEDQIRGLTKMMPKEG